MNYWANLGGDSPTGTMCRASNLLKPQVPRIWRLATLANAACAGVTIRAGVGNVCSC